MSRCDLRIIFNLLTLNFYITSGLCV